MLPAFSLLQDRHERTRADGWSWQDDDAERRDVWDIHGYWYGNPLLACSRGSSPSCLYRNQISRYLEARAPHGTVTHHPPSSADCKHAFYQISTLLPSLTPAAMRINKPLYNVKVPVSQPEPMAGVSPTGVPGVGVWSRGVPQSSRGPPWLTRISCQVPLSRTDGSEPAPSCAPGSESKRPHREQGTPGGLGQVLYRRASYGRSAAAGRAVLPGLGVENHSCPSSSWNCPG